MTQTAMFKTLPVTPVTVQEVATNVLLVEWLVKLQQQISLQQRLLEEKQSQIEAQHKQIEELTDSLDKLKSRDSKNSSVPPSSDQLKKPSDKSKRKKGKKRGPKYDHRGKTRNGFGQPDQVEKLALENCPVCGTDLELVEGTPEKVQQVALVGRSTSVQSGISPPTVWLP